jgi:hypothetical protein
MEMLGIISWFQRFEPFDVAQDKLHEAVERLERLEQITLEGSPSPL